MNIVNLSLIACTLLLSVSCNRKMAKDKQTANAVTLQGTPSDIVSPGPGPTDQEEGDNTASNGQDTNMGNDSTVNSNRTGNSNYDLVLSFYSIGAGIDHEAKKSYSEFLDKHKDRITVETTRWGREGEVDYCLKLSSLSEGEKKDFIDKSRQILEKSKLVHIRENSPCVHKK